MFSDLKGKNGKLSIFFVLLSFCFFSLNVVAQTAQTGVTTYTGTVVDDSDVPLPGVTVVIKGISGVGTTTNADGEFLINVPADKHTLVFTYVGMKQQEVRVSGGKRLTVRMQADEMALKETVITGIYTRKAESFTGSAKTYKADELKSVGNQNILQSLSALDPSFVIADNNLMGSDPNTMMNVSINGTTSITGLSDVKSTTVYT